MDLNTMTKEERSLLLYFETCAVDFAGKVDPRRMNVDDFAIAKNWSEDKFVSFGRIKYKDIKGTFSHWCSLSDLAWELAHRERRARAERMNKNIVYGRVNYGE